MARRAAPPTLKAVAQKLGRLYPEVEALTDPFHLILWENAGYLIDDEKRAAVFARLKEQVGVTPNEILGASRSRLLAILDRSGLHSDMRADRMKESAEIAINVDGDLLEALRAMPNARARALLKEFPAIGDPGADKILLFADLDARPSLESNGLRTLMRLGFVPEQGSYSANYKSAVDLIKREGRLDRAWLMRLYHSLRDHGRALCKRAAPQCMACPFDSVCAHASVKPL